ncbi:hypothetical protein FB451DRAFT_1389951 [Mycena latifolia]|nr:hypothetical protein FB451DRAFT_1389951 [Mycena latifolia]
MREFAQELVDLVIDEVVAAEDIGICGRVCSVAGRSSEIPGPRGCFLTPLLLFVRSLDIRIIYEPFTEAQVARLQNGSALAVLCIHVIQDHVRAEELRLQRWLQTHMPRSAPPVWLFPVLNWVTCHDIPLCIVAYIISGLSNHASATLWQRLRRGCAI